MKSIAEQILDGLDRFYKAFQRKRVLKSLEEVLATTNEEDVASAMTVAALNNKLANGRVELVVNNDESLGYRLDGADTVHPFKTKHDIILGLSWGTLGGNMQQLAYTSVKAPCNGTLSYTFQQSAIQAYAKKNGVTFASLATYSEHMGYGTQGTVNVKKDDVITLTTGSRTGHSNSVLFIGRYQ